jgi:RraA family protein
MSEKPKSAEMTPGPGFMIRTNFQRPSKELVDAFREFETADVSDVMNRMYALTGEIRNLANDAILVGPACTVKVFPGDNLMVHKALDILQPGDVIVIDTSGSSNNAVIGDLVATKAMHRGAAGFIVDGLVRDLAGLVETGLPIYARGITPFGPLHRGPGEINFPISCGGIVVNPGDIVKADADGVAIIPLAFAETILERLRENRARQANYVAAVKRGEFSNAWVDAQLADDNCFAYD